MVSSPWLPPRGSWIFWQSALRNRLPKKTDEGQRKLKISTVVRWMAKTKTTTIHPAAFIDQPVATPHQSRQTIGSEVPIVHRDSFPPGEAKGCKPLACTLYYGGCGIFAAASGLKKCPRRTGGLNRCAGERSAQAGGISGYTCPSCPSSCRRLRFSPAARR